MRRTLQTLRQSDFRGMEVDLTGRLSSKAWEKYGSALSRFSPFRGFFDNGGGFDSRFVLMTGFPCPFATAALGIVPTYIEKMGFLQVWTTMTFARFSGFANISYNEMFNSN